MGVTVWKVREERSGALIRKAANELPSVPNWPSAAAGNGSGARVELESAARAEVEPLRLEAVRPEPPDIGAPLQVVPRDVLAPRVNPVEEVVGVDERVNDGHADARHAGDVVARQSPRADRIGKGVDEVQLFGQRVVNIVAVHIHEVAVVAEARFHEERGAPLPVVVEDRRVVASRAGHAIADFQTQQCVLRHRGRRVVVLHEDRIALVEVVIHAAVVVVAVETERDVAHDVVHQARLAGFG